MVYGGAEPEPVDGMADREDDRWVTIAQAAETLELSAHQLVDHVAH